MQGKRILIIDDDPDVRTTVKRFLDLDSSYTIEEAGNGLVAEEKIKEFSPDLIILDINIPGKGGYEICLDIRNNRAMKDVKIIAISGYDSSVRSAIMDSLGADYFFEKPFYSHKLTEKVKELLAG